MTTAYQDQSFTRGDPFKPGVLTLEAKDADDFEVDVPVSAFATLVCTVRRGTSPASALVAQVSLTPNVQGAIVPVSSNQVQILIHGSVTALWTDQNEYYYEVRGVLVADGEPHAVVKGRIVLGWNLT